MKTTLSLVMTALAALPLLAADSGSTPAAAGVRITELADRLRIEIHGQLFTEYVFKDTPRPYCYPLLGPGGLPMTRNWPMKAVEGEDRDHPHHRSLWFTHGAVNGHDFWSESGKFGRVVHQAFAEVKSGPKEGVIRSRNHWIAADGTLVGSDERVLRVFARPDTERLFDFEVTLKAGDKEIVLGDTKEGSMAIRLAETMRLTKSAAKGEPKGTRGDGHIVNSEGVRDGDTWGKRAAWCDYHGPVEGRTVGVAIFDHPSNPRHPTWWHVRDYGLFAANPFGQHDFEKLADKTAGDLRVPAGQSVTFRYRFYLHQGDEQQARVAGRYAEYLKETATSSK